MLCLQHIQNVPQAAAFAQLEDKADIWGAHAHTEEGDNVGVHSHTAKAGFSADFPNVHCQQFLTGRTEHLDGCGCTVG
jgi:hypothetical protein